MIYRLLKKNKSPCPAQMKRLRCQIFCGSGCGWCRSDRFVRGERSGVDVAVAKGRRHKGGSGTGRICGSGVDDNAADTRDGGTNPVRTAVCEGAHVRKTRLGNATWGGKKGGSKGCGTGGRDGTLRACVNRSGHGNASWGGKRTC